MGLPRPQRRDTESIKLVVAAMASEAPSRWNATSQIGSPSWYWAMPIPACTISTSSSSIAALLRSSQKQTTLAGNGCVDHAGMQAGEQHRVEAVPVGVLVTGVGPAAGQQGAEPDRQPHQYEGDPGDGHGQARYPCRCKVPGLPHQPDCERDQHHRQQQVQAHHVRVELGEHGDAADDALEWDAKCKGSRQPAQVASWPPIFPIEHGADEGERRGNDQHEGEKPVPELDRSVDAELGMGNVGVLGAPRPGWAPQPGTRQPDQTTGDDNRDVHDQRDDRPSSQCVRPTHDAEHGGQRPTAPSCFGLGGQLLYDVHRKPFQAARPAATSQANKTTTGQLRSCPFAAARRPSPNAAVGKISIIGCSAVG